MIAAELPFHSHASGANAALSASAAEERLRVGALGHKYPQKSAISHYCGF